MAWSSGRWGFTLIEVLIVVAILALLVAVLLGVASSIYTQRDTALTKNGLDILDAALAEFREITGKYPIDHWTPSTDRDGTLIAGATPYGVSSDPDPSEVLYLQLILLPQTRDIIAKLPNQLLIEPLDSSGDPIRVELPGQPGTPTPYLRRIVDAWGNALEYDDYDDPDRFPLIRSGGADEEPTTAEDNITNED